MQVSLYQFIDVANVANKLFGLSPVYSGDITPFNNFDARNCQFILDTLYQVNYAKYTFNGREYYGHVTPQARADGLYVYTITVDRLTTAWYNGCFYKFNSVKYSSDGGADIPDSRLSLKMSPDIQYIDIETVDNFYYDNYYALTVLHPFIDTTARPQAPFAESTQTYLMDRDAFKSFLLTGLPNIDPDVRQSYLQSVISLYSVPAHALPIEFTLDAAFDKTTTIKLFKDYDTPQNVTISGECWKLNGTKTESSFFPVIQSRVNYSMTYTPELANAQFEMHIRDCGVLSFTFSAIRHYLPANGKITSIGYRRAFNFVSGDQTCYLELNGSPIREVSVQSHIPEQIPIMVPSYLNNWFNLVSGTLAGNATGQTVNRQKNTSHLSAITSINMGLFSQLQSTLFDIRTSGSTRVGSIGGTTDRFDQIGSYVIIKHQSPIDKEFFQSLYGKPDGRVVNLATLTGYVQTDRCQLIANGLEQDIVETAQSLCDLGYYVRV